MRALLFYAAMAVVIVWRLPKLRAQGESRVTILWVILWILAGVFAAMWFWGPETWRLAEAVTG